MRHILVDAAVDRHLWTNSPHVLLNKRHDDIESSCLVESCSLIFYC